MEDSDVLKSYSEYQADRAIKKLMDELKMLGYGFDKKLSLIDQRNDKWESLIKDSQLANKVNIFMFNIKDLQLKISNVEGKVAFVSSDLAKQSQQSLQSKILNIYQIDFLNFQQNMNDMLNK